MLNKIQDLITELEAMDAKNSKLVAQIEKRTQTLKSLEAKILANDEILLKRQKEREDLDLAQENINSELKKLDEFRKKLEVKEKALQEQKARLDIKEEKLNTKAARVQRILND